MSLRPQEIHPFFGVGMPRGPCRSGRRHCFRHSSQPRLFSNCGIDMDLPAVSTKKILPFKSNRIKPFTSTVDEKLLKTSVDNKGEI
jgi:hypothetical protein